MPQAWPTGNRFLILEDKPKEKSEAGVYIPKEDELRGTVVKLPHGVAAFDSVTGLPVSAPSKMTIHKGCRVMWRKGAFFETLKIDGIPYLLGGATDIACTLPPLDKADNGT